MNSPQNRINAIEKEIDETKYLLQQNTHKIVERDSHLDDIEHKSAGLMLNANTFKRKTKTLKRNNCVSYYLPTIIIVLFFFIIIVILISKAKK